MTIRTPAQIVQPAIVLAGVIACVILGRTSHSAAAPVTATSVAQVPLTVATPAHPQIVIAIGNSQSMDGNLSGGVNPGGIAKLSGELEFCSSASAGLSEPEPVMMAPLRLPSIDWELPIAIMICGCAGVATVSGTCATLVAVTGAAAE